MVKAVFKITREIIFFFYIQKQCDWNERNAGGSRNSKTYENNPKIPIEFIADNPSQVLIKIEANK